MAASPEQIRSVGVVGLGYWGPKLARCFHQLGVLKWACDLDPGRVQEVCKWDPSIQGTTDYESMLDHVDAIAIATQPETHYGIAKRALLVCKHVFVEKPLATTYNEASELEELAEKEERRLMVGHIYLHCPGITTMIRPVGKAELYISLLNREGPPNGTNRDIVWAALPHAASLALHFFPDKPWITKVRQREHRIQARLDYWNGSRVYIDVGDFTGRQERRVELRSGPLLFLYDGNTPDQHLFLTGNGFRQVVGDNKEPLLLELEHFLSFKGVDPLGAKVVRLVEEITWVDALGAKMMRHLEELRWREGR